MARASKVEPCILCDEMPCVCKKPAAKPKKPPVKKPVVKLDLPRTSDPDAAPGTAEEVVQFQPAKRSAFDAMKAKAKPLPQAAPPPEPETDGEAAMFAQAVRALEPILHPQEKAKYSYILGTPETVGERRAAWLARRKTN